MSAHVLLSLLNELGKRDKIQGLPSILSLFRNEFNKFNNTRARISLSDLPPPKVYKSHIFFKWNDLINCILHVFCLNCLLKSRTYYGMRCGKTSGIMTSLILTRVVIHQLAAFWKSF